MKNPNTPGRISSDKGSNHPKRRRPKEGARPKPEQVKGDPEEKEPAPAEPTEQERRRLDDKVDEASWESFPASDPPSFNP